MSAEHDTDLAPIKVKRVYDIAVGISASGLEADFLKLCEENDLHLLANTRTRRIIGEYINRKFSENKAEGLATRSIQTGDCDE